MLISGFWYHFIIISAPFASKFHSSELKTELKVLVSADENIIEFVMLSETIKY